MTVHDKTTAASTLENKWEEVTLIIIMKCTSRKDSNQDVAEGVADAIMDGYGFPPGWTATASVISRVATPAPDPEEMAQARRWHRWA